MILFENQCEKLQQEMSSGGGGSIQGTPGDFDEKNPSLIREGGSNVDFILKAIRIYRDQDKQNPNRLLSIADIRQMVVKKRPDISKEEFDSIILAFSNRGIINLHHHDHPTGVSPEERNAMVKGPCCDDRGVPWHFIGLTLEEPPQNDIFEIDRNEMFDEMMLREKIQQEIWETFKNEMQQVWSGLQQESILRTKIRQMILEKSKEKEIEPHASTGINVLEDVLKTIIPQVEEDFKSLTSNPEQRESYKAHILKAVQQVLIQGDINDDAAKSSSEKEPQITEEMLAEWVNHLSMLSDADINIGIDQPVDPIDGNKKFIDVDGDNKPDEEPVDTFGIPGQNETGRNMAEQTFDKIENQILDAYRILSDEQDQKLFFDYLLTNLKMYFEKFESEMDVSVEEPLTDPETEMGSEPSGAELPPL